MASNETYIGDEELTELYNSLEKGSLVRMLIDKHRQLEKQVKKLTIPVVVGRSEQLCVHPLGNLTFYNDNTVSCSLCGKEDIDQYA